MQFNVNFTPSKVFKTTGEIFKGGEIFKNFKPSSRTSSRLQKTPI